MVDPTVLALAGVVVAGLAAIASPFASLMIARARNDHERRQAAIDRRQRRREAAYRDLMPYLLLIRDHAARTQPIIHREGDPGPPEPLPEDELRRIETEVALHGSLAVLTRLQKVGGLSRSFYVHAEIYQDWRLGRGAAQAAAEGSFPGQEMEAKRQELFEAVRATQALVNDELREE